MGSWQSDALQDHDHWTYFARKFSGAAGTGTAGSFPNNQGISDPLMYTSMASVRGFRTSSETRGTNVALAARLHV